MPTIKMDVTIRVRCSDCGILLEAETFNGGPPTITVKPHVCEIKPMPVDIHCTLSMALDSVGEKHVEVHYWKKNGDFRILNGYFPSRPDGTNAKLGYVFFLEGVAGCHEPKNLIRKEITEIRLLTSEDVYVIH